MNIFVFVYIVDILLTVSLINPLIFFWTLGDVFVDTIFVTFVNAATQCLWLQGILGEFGIETETSTVIYCDNQRTICISTDPVLRPRAKHIEIHMHYIRGLVHDGVIDLQYCASSEKVADIFTKMFSERNFKIIK